MAGEVRVAETARVELVPATETERPVVQNLARFYVYDLSAFAGWPCPKDGLYACRDLADYWGPEGLAFTIRADGALAGFALVDRPSPLGGADYWMGEFFVLAAYRRRGVGRAAALAAFRRLPGTWQVGQIPGNAPAIAFWRRVIDEATGGRFGEDQRWVEQAEARMNVMAFAA